MLVTVDEVSCWVASRSLGLVVGPGTARICYWTFKGHVTLE